MKKSKYIVTLIIGCVAACTSVENNTEEIVPKVAVVNSFENTEQAKYGLTKLSDYNFFTGDLKELKPTEQVLPYELNAPLFTDYASKKRFIYLPKGTQMEFHEKEAFTFPDSTVIIKNFYYSAEQTGEQERILETRLLLKHKGEWSALPYIWNNEQTEAFLDVTGGTRKVTLADKGSFDYVIPNFKQCKNCHDYNGKFSPIGPKAQQLNTQLQLAKWTMKGILKNVPENYAKHLADYSDPKLLLDHRARSYLDANCSYCHRPGGSAKNSGLDLTVDSPTDFSLGINKGPVAAGKGSGGLQYDIVPGQPEASILHYRMNSSDPAVMMPELGRSLIHEEGVALIAKWIKSLGQT